jgi:hypothetical protein
MIEREAGVGAVRAKSFISGSAQHAFPAWRAVLSTQRTLRLQLCHIELLNPRLRTLEMLLFLADIPSVESMLNLCMEPDCHARMSIGVSFPSATFR